MPQGSWAYIQFVDRPPGGRPGGGRPVDPGWGVEGPDEGGGEGIWGPTDPRPGYGLPGGERPSRPPRPGQGLPPSFPGHPSHPIHRPGFGGRPVDPGYGIPEGGPPTAGQLPVFPLEPGHPIAPPIPGEEPPPVDPPPGTIWPPLPDTGLPEGKALALMAIATSGGQLAYHYVVITIPPGKPDQGLPGEGGEPPQVQPPIESPPPQPRGRR